MSELHRFRPTRAGIVNLYEYVDQVFTFSGGRLLLRGHNTSGKTKALELLLPFVLDGDIAPHRLDPFAQSAKHMKWNVVGCTDVDQRVGYVWLEFERLDDGGGIERITAGIGLRAHRDRPEVKRWHFVVHGRRVGTDLLLVRDLREPLSRGDLIAAIGEDGEVFDHQADYRARLRERLLDLSTEEQHQTMLRLMRELRRPHLSKTLEPDGVAEMLSAGLPEVDGGLMLRLAAGLEQLESLEARLQRLRGVRDKVRRFHDRTYRAYLRSELRERASALRTTEGEVDRASEAMRRVTAEHDSAVAEQARLAAGLVAAHEDVERWEGQERALVESAAWGAVTDVEGLRERAAAQDRTAATLEERHADAAAAASTHEAELILAEEGLAQSNEAAAGDLERLAMEARRAGLHERTRALDEQLRDAAISPRSWRELVGELAAGRAAVFGEHTALLVSAQSACEAVDRARERERAYGARADQATQSRDAAAAELESERAQFDAALDAWYEPLVELAPGADVLDAARALGHNGDSSRPAFELDADRVRRAVAADRAAIEVKRDRLQVERDELAARQAALEDECDDPPAAPAWRSADRSGRTGGPLWALVDFATGVDGDARAGVESALEASGLLDAWITPTGEALDPGTIDASLAAAASVDGPSLADVLVPVADGPVAPGVIERVLRGIALDAGVVAIGQDGRFRLGPLSGAAIKPAPEHVGAVARAARRARLIEEISGARDILDRRLAELATALDAVAGRGVRLEQELLGLPSAQDVAARLRGALLADSQARAATIEHESARTALAHAQDAELAARALVREHAVAHALEAGLDQRGVAVRRESCVRLESGAGGVAQRFEHVAALRTDVAQRGARLEQLRERTAQLHARARDERTEARRLEAEHAAREGALGVEEREVRERHEHAQHALRAARSARDALAVSERATAIRAGQLERDARTGASALSAARDRRADAHRGLVALAVAGLLPLALAGDAPHDHEQASDWTMTRALEVARGLPAAVTSTSTLPGQQAENVMRGVADLDRELAQADMGAHAAPARDGLLLVQITDGLARRAFGEAVADLDAEIADRQRVLSAEERRVFGDAIVEELAEHLRVRVHDVHGRVDRMNAVLRRAPTAAGKVVQLQWHPIDDEELRDATEILRRSARYLDEAKRQSIVDFFRRRVELARRAVSDGAPEPMAATLATAFDYRSWHRFELLLEIEGRRTRLTKRSHAVGSGGEQSALIHLPLFAAAAALYADGSGPRLVMLDEALSGIDDDTRERVLAATVAFDLDIVMTSHELWGTYVTVPSLSIYQLYRENGVYGVHAIPFLWDGAQLREDEQGELFVA